MKQSGKIIWWDDHSGDGFIQSDENQRPYYFRYTSVDNNLRIREGALVVFDVEVGDEEDMAVSVEIVD